MVFSQHFSIFSRCRLLQTRSVVLLLGVVLFAVVPDQALALDCIPACQAGRGVCISGRCFCRDPWGGDDCSLMVRGIEASSSNDGATEDAATALPTLTALSAPVGEDGYSAHGIHESFVQAHATSPHLSDADDAADGNDELPELLGIPADAEKPAPVSNTQHRINLIPAEPPKQLPDTARLAAPMQADESTEASFQRPPPKQPISQITPVKVEPVHPPPAPPQPVATKVQAQQNILSRYTHDAGQSASKAVLAAKVKALRTPRTGSARN